MGLWNSTRVPGAPPVITQGLASVGATCLPHGWTISEPAFLDPAPSSTRCLASQTSPAQSPALAVPTSPFPPCYLHVVASGRHGLTELKANFTLPILHCHPYHLCPLARTWHATPLGLLSQSGKPSSLDLSLLPLLTFNPSADLVALSQIYTVSSSVPKPKPEPPTRHGGPQQGSPHPHVLPTLAHILSGTAIRSVTPLLETVDTPHLARDKSRCPKHNLQGLAQTHPLPLACHAPATLALLLLTHFCH